MHKFSMALQAPNPSRRPRHVTRLRLLRGTEMASPSARAALANLGSHSQDPETLRLDFWMNHGTFCHGRFCQWFFLGEL